MPSQKENEAKAQAFERFLTGLDETNPDHFVAFYAALHRLNAYLAHRGVHPRNHAERNAIANRLPVHKE